MRLKPHEKLKQARLNAGFKSALAASEANGWAQITYNRHEKGTIPFRKKAPDYARAFNVPLESLLDPDEYIAASTPVWEMPLVAINDITSLTAILRGAELETQSHLFPCGPRTFMIRNPDLAMSSEDYPRVRPGDLLAFDPDAEISRGDLVLASIDGQTDALFRAFFPRSNETLLLPLNSAWPQTVVKEARIIGKFVFAIIAP